MDEKKIVKVFIRPVNHCNFMCKHCFVDKELLKKEELSLVDTKKFLELLAIKFSSVYVRFHGGEPTLVGKAFYKEVFEYQSLLSKKYGSVFFNTIQTNGYFLDEEYIKIFIDGNCSIGISYDGNHNDVLRPYSEEVFNRICLLKKSNARFSAICVETQKTINNVFDTYEWFKSKHIHFKFHPVLPRGFAKYDSSLVLDIDNYVSKITELYKIWLMDKDCDIRVSTFEEFVRIKQGKMFKKIWFERNRFSLNSDGKLYVYGYPNEKKYSLGCINQLSSLEDIFLLPNYKKLQFDIESLMLKKCNNCSVKDICRGACICSSFLFDGGEENISYSCNLARRTFEEVLKINEQVEEDSLLKRIGQYNKYVRDIYEGL